MKIILFAAVLSFYLNIIILKVIISEYLLTSEYFLEKVQIGYLNAVLDKLAKKLEKMRKFKEIILSLACVFNTFLAFIRFK